MTDSKYSTVSFSHSIPVRKSLKLFLFLVQKDILVLLLIHVLTHSRPGDWHRILPFKLLLFILLSVVICFVVSFRVTISQPSTSSTPPLCTCTKRRKITLHTYGANL
ncbi:hypothetical protein BC826DRAFT_631059 [Russula brevipes]|nr:hypothetical protein BC826DRAFT_631059 [Russula brevipes]